MAFNIQESLDFLTQVADQVTASQGATDEVRNLGRALQGASNRVSDNATTLVDRSGYSEEAMFALADMLAQLAELTLPAKASVTWKSPEVQDVIEKLTAAKRLEMLSDAQVTLFEGALVTLKAGGSGVRGPRGEAAVIEGRSTRVHIYNGDQKVADLGGNTAQSPGNLVQRLASAKLLNITDKASDEYKALKVYATQACEGETVSIPGTPLTLVPFEPEQD